MEKLGEKIEGSRYYRNFCRNCEEPIRVTEQKRNDAVACDTCTSPVLEFSQGTGGGWRVIKSTKGLA